VIVISYPMFPFYILSDATQFMRMRDFVFTVQKRYALDSTIILICTSLYIPSEKFFVTTHNYTCQSKH